MERLLPLSSLLVVFPMLIQASPEVLGGTPMNPIETEAREFMAGYAEDIRAGRRKSLVARYDPCGAYRVGEGHKIFETHAMIRASYETEWNPPRTFEWRDLSYEVIGESTVLVVGLFDWGTRHGRTLAFSYTGILVRQDGGLRIRLEDESRSR
jgi:hypothetical protein